METGRTCQSCERVKPARDFDSPTESHCRRCKLTYEAAKNDLPGLKDFIKVAGEVREYDALLRFAEDKGLATGAVGRWIAFDWRSRNTLARLPGVLGPPRSAPRGQ
jgi:hypothetical protein